MVIFSIGTQKLASDFFSAYYSVSIFRRPHAFVFEIASYFFVPKHNPICGGKMVEHSVRSYLEVVIMIHSKHVTVEWRCQCLGVAIISHRSISVIILSQSAL